MAPKTSKTPLSDRLGALQRAVVACRVRGRGLEDDHAAAQAEVGRLSEARVEAFASGDEALAGDLQLERELAAAKVRDCEERVAGAGRAVLRAESEVAQHATHSLDGLLSERNADATAVAGAVDQAIEQLGRAHAAWSAMEQEITGLLRLAGQNTRDVPRFPAGLEQLVRDARHAAGVPVPPPVPQSLESAAWSVAPMHDPDPEVRESARAEILAKGSRGAA